MNFDPHYNPYPSRRMPVYASNGMVATSQPLAAQAGLTVLQQGGNAIDAAIAAAAALTVVEPTSNGIGGDAFALVWTGGKLHGLNASGRAPKLLSLEALTTAGVTEMPKYGFTPVTVPGAPGAWAEMAKRFGRLPLTASLAPAIRYADEGYPLSPTLARAWGRAFAHYTKELTADASAPWFATFAPDGRAPLAGERWRSPDHAKTLAAIAESDAAAFYRGELAEAIEKFALEHGGYIRGEDLDAFTADWVEPISVNYRGYDVWEIPPNGHGIVALMALNILQGFDLDERETVASYHRQIEAMKLAFSDGREYIADADHMQVTTAQLLNPDYAAERRKLIGDTALTPAPGKPTGSGTVYLATADGEGNMVSFIQSNYMGFGSGIVVPGTGIALQNRGHNFCLEPEHPNCVGSGKRSYHTIIPGFLTRNGEAMGPFGVMGGFMQPQGHAQIIVNTIDFGLNPQAALDAPRWQWHEGKRVELEPTVPQHVADALQRRGHDVQYTVTGAPYGRGQIIWRQPDGTLVGGTEPRTDGHIAAY